MQEFSSFENCLNGRGLHVAISSNENHLQEFSPFENLLNGEEKWVQKNLFKKFSKSAGILRIDVEYNKYYYLFITFNIKETIYIIILYIKIPIQCKVPYSYII